MAKRKSGKPYNFYAIKRGKQTGLFTDWSLVSQLVEGFSKNDHQGFYEIEEAIEWLLQDHKLEYKPDEIHDISIIPLNHQISYNMRQGKSQPPTSISIDELRSVDIGKWGEELAYIALKQKFLNKYPNSQLKETRNKACICDSFDNVIAEICWNNQYEESRKSYDMSTIDGNVETFIEVKSSLGNQISPIPNVTPKEIEFAREKKDMYYVIRICGVGSKNAIIYEIPNPFLSEYSDQDETNAVHSKKIKFAPPKELPERESMTGREFFETYFISGNYQPLKNLKKQLLRGKISRKMRKRLFKLVGIRLPSRAKWDKEVHVIRY